MPYSIKLRTKATKAFRWVRCNCCGRVRTWKTLRQASGAARAMAQQRGLVVHAAYDSRRGWTVRNTPKAAKHWVARVQSVTTSRMRTIMCSACEQPRPFTSCSKAMAYAGGCVGPYNKTAQGAGWGLLKYGAVLVDTPTP